jgi:hypothetical protein
VDVDEDMRTRLGFRVTADVYNAMWRSWCKCQSIQGVADEVGVDDQTVKRYVDGPGDPSKGMEPIRARWLRVEARAQTEEELTLLTYRKRKMELVEEMIGSVSDELKLVRAEVQSRIAEYLKEAGKPGAPAPRVIAGIDKLSTALDKLVRLGDKLMGGADITTEQRGGTGKWQGWTTEELVEYATTGVIPEHARKRLSAKERKGE